MRTSRHLPLAALGGAGLLWGTTVPLTKLALAWLDPGWLAAARFAPAAVLLAWATRRRLRSALSPAIVAWGAGGYGGVVVLQNAGIARTSVSHAALLVGAAPVLIALIAVGLGRGGVRPLSWVGFGVALAGVGVIAADGGGAATLAGDGLVFGSVLLSAAFVVAQQRLLVGRDPVAVTAVQLTAAAAAAVPTAFLLDGVPRTAPTPTALLVLAGLVVGGTLAPFTLFAYGQARVAPAVAGAFLNLEPLVGAAAGALAFGELVGLPHVLGGVAILGGIGLSSLAVIRPTPRRAALSMG